jgi:hypothetical protein
MHIRCNAFQPFEKNTLRGFAKLSVELDEGVGLIINDVMYHVKNASAWVNLPSKKYEKNGATSYMPIVDYMDTASKYRFGDAAVKAVQAFIENGGQE